MTANRSSLNSHINGADGNDSQRNDFQIDNLGHVTHPNTPQAAGHEITHKDKKNIK